MKARKVILSVIVALLLVGTIAHAQPGEGYTVVEGVASGGGYRLTALDWQACGVSSGGGYRLLQSDSPDLAGSGCCCVYLPAITRHVP